MKLYTVIVEDRHADVECFVFDTPEAAIDRARAEANDISDEWEGEQIDGWLFAARCSEEGDYVHVIETELNPVWPA